MIRERFTRRFVAVAVFAMICVAIVWRVIILTITPWTGVEFVARSDFGDRPGFRAEVVEGSPAAEAGIRDGDYIVGVNGIRASDPERLRDASAQFGDVIRYEVRKVDGTKEVEVIAGSRWSNIRLTVEVVVNVIVALTFLATGLLVLLRRTNDERVTVFVGMCLAGGVTFLVSLLFGASGALGDDPFRNYVIRETVGKGAGVWFLAFLFHLSQVFPRERPWIRKRPRGHRLFIHGLPVCATIVFLGLAGSFDPTLVGCLILPVMVALIMVMIGAPVSFVLSYRESSPEEKLQLRWPLFGSVLAIAGALLIPLVITVGPAATEGFRAGWADAQAEHAAAPAPERPAEDHVWVGLVEAISPLLLVTIPVTFALGIMRYRLLGIDRLIRKTTLYLLALGVLGLLYAAITVTISQGVLDAFRQGFERTAGQSLGPIPAVAVSLVTLISALFILPVLYVFHRQAERKLFPRRFRYPTALTRLGAVSESSAEWRTLKLSYEQVIREELEMDVRVDLDGRNEDGNADPAARRRTVGVPGHADASLTYSIDGEGDDRRLEEFFGEVVRRLAIGLDRIALERQKVEIEQARLVQERLIPTPLPQPPGFAVAGAWTPATVVSGDLYDVIRIDDHRYAFCIGDVVGKGMAAALLMSSLQATVRAFASLSLSPAEMCRRIHALMRENMSLGKFITFFYAMLDTDSGKLTFASAGHIPPIVIRADGSLEELYSGGGALGAFRRMSFHEQTMQLRTGDRIVCVTDAVTEARSGEEEFGEERLRDLLRRADGLNATELRDRIVAEVTAFGGGTLQDDLAVLVVECLLEG